jgi:hypothetical protein
MVELPIRTRSIIAGDGSVTVTHALHVACPARRGSVDLDVCRTCPRLHAVSERLVECAPIAAPREGEAAVGSIAPVHVTLVRAEVPVAALESLVPRELAVPVIDEVGRFLGFFATGRTLGPLLPPRLERAMPVGARVFGATLLVHEGTPWPQAARLMARLRGRAVAITDESGAVRGVLRDLDALRAMAAARVLLSSPVVRAARVTVPGPGAGPGQADVRHLERAEAEDHHGGRRPYRGALPEAGDQPCRRSHREERR